MLSLFQRTSPVDETPSACLVRTSEKHLGASRPCYVLTRHRNPKPLSSSRDFLCLCSAIVWIQQRKIGFEPGFWLISSLPRRRQEWTSSRRNVKFFLASGANQFRQGQQHLRGGRPGKLHFNCFRQLRLVPSLSLCRSSRQVSLS